MKVSECEPQSLLNSSVISAVGKTNSNLQLMGGSITKEFTDIYTNEQSDELTYVLYFFNRFILQ